MARPKLPDPVTRALQPFTLEPAGSWLVISDIHIPFHDAVTLELAVVAARRRRVAGVLLNGDILDCHELSRWDKSPDDPRYREEIAAGRQFLAWLRSRLGPRPRIIWKDGNHEERLLAYLAAKAPALFGLDVLTLPNLLHFDRHGVKHVTDRRVIRAGKLNVIHGHEYRPNITAPVNPARGLFLRSKNVALCGHFHQTSEHHEPDITGKPRGCWSVGCACDLAPMYMPLNKWNHGFAFVEWEASGEFSVDNHRVLAGHVLRGGRKGRKGRKGGRSCTRR